MTTCTPKKWVSEGPQNPRRMRPRKFFFPKPVSLLPQYYLNPAPPRPNEPERPVLILVTRPPLVRNVVRPKPDGLARPTPAWPPTRVPLKSVGRDRGS